MWQCSRGFNPDTGVEPKIRGGFTPKSSILSSGFPWNKPSILGVLYTPNFGSTPI